MTEEWRPIPGFPYYAASSLGRIKRLAGTPKCRVERILRQKVRRAVPGRLPYREVNLSHDAKTGSQTVHKLIALAFHGERPSPEHEVAHGDGDPANNTPGNLRWATLADNKADYRLHGRTTRSQAGRERDARSGRYV